MGVYTDANIVMGAESADGFRGGQLFLFPQALTDGARGSDWFRLYGVTW
jgi:hypothetical protein